MLWDQNQQHGVRANAHNAILAGEILNGTIVEAGENFSITTR